MPAPIVAAIIVAAVTLSGFVIQGMFISRWIDKRRLADAKETEELKGNIALENAGLIEKLRAELTLVGARRQRSQDSRRESLELLFNACSIAKSAAHELLSVSVSQSRAYTQNR